MPAVDLLLSSGFLAFARHAGFLRAVEEAGVEVGGVYGTSSGALVGALWAAGVSAEGIAERLSRSTPLRWMRFTWTPWSGVFSMAAVIEELRADLPERIEDLPRPFAAGVRASDGSYRFVERGPLAEAVAASCAIPWVFRAVEVAGERLQDGGVVDRLGFAGWRALRGERPVVVHLVERTGGAKGTPVPEGVPVVRTPRSGARFWDLGDFAGQLEEARTLARAVIPPTRAEGTR